MVVHPPAGTTGVGGTSEIGASEASDYWFVRAAAKQGFLFSERSEDFWIERVGQAGL